MGFDAENGMSLGSYGSQGKTACDASLMAVYANTWYPVLSTNCNGCHSGAHGSTDMSTSFSAFMTKGSNLITYKGSNPHGGNNVNISGQVAGFSGTWAAAQNDYVTCLSSSSSDPGNPAGALVTLNAKIVPQINQTVTNQNQWKTVTWDLETEVPSNFAGQFAAIFTVEARYALYSGAVVGMEFRNPRMRLKTAMTSPIQVNAINIKIDGAMMTDVTTYTAVNALISTTTATDVAPGASASLAVAPVNDNSLVSFVFSNLQAGSAVTTTTMVTTSTTMPGAVPVTLAQLLSTDPTLGVFNQSCVGCHNAGNAAGGFNITNSAQAIAKASNILSRMKNPAAPMPTTGVLGTAKIKVVEDWISGGIKP